MAKLTLEGLKALREKAQKESRLREGDGKSFQVIVGMGTCGIAAGAKGAYDAIEKAVAEAGLSGSVIMRKTGCMGLCFAEPTVELRGGGVENAIYGRVDAAAAAEIVKKHIQGKVVLESHLYPRPARDILADQDAAKQRQVRIVLRNCGVIDPESIDEYIARDGYVALAKAVSELKPEGIIEEIKIAGLRGRGGAGFPAWKKWDITRAVQDSPKYVVCNADEGDPGAYMDRSTIEGDPHSVIEAMAICGRAIGSNHGVIYIRAEYPLAVSRLEIAIKQATELGLMGKGILGSDHDFEIEVRLGAGAFVCGEETALLQSVMGSRGMPVPKPPFPAVKGLWKKPTVINNVETFANVPAIIAKGGKWFASIGTETSKGTKVFALTGQVNNSGLVEVPMGTTLRQIIYEVGGGIRNGLEFKGVQTGGPSGGIITAESLDTPIDYESLAKLGSMMGSGGMIVMDEKDCVVDVSKFYMDFCVDESCGKCAPCRIGTTQMHGILDRISKGKGEMADLQKLKDIGKAMTKASLCLLGGSAANPTLSTMRAFEDEYLEHIRDKKCRAGKCKELMVYGILAEKCIGCGLCARRCPVNAISGEKKSPHVIDQAKCIKCGECFSVCKFGAVTKN
jgi:NADH:ubiquinone oxidoreductase subunit F (NADH-binding)/(2Fe-2S) ferredoxin